MNKNKKVFIITITFLMLVGLTTIAATDIDGNDTTTIADTNTQTTPETTTTQTKTINENNINTKEASTSQTDNIQETMNTEETINNKNGEKTENLKASRTETVTTYTELNSYLTSNFYDTVTLNIGNDIQLAGNITVNRAIKTLTINGNGKTIDGNGQYRFLYISVRDGPDRINVLIDNITITKCTSGRGGAISNWKPFTNLIITNSNLTHNTADIGGAIYFDGGILTITNSNLTYNTADAFGGAILSNRETNITNSNLTHNTAKIGGGAIYNLGGILNITNSNLTHNNASYGGAIYNGDGYLNITKSNLTHNNATEYGGAIYNNNTVRYLQVIYPHDSNVTITNSNITHNYANSGGAIYANYTHNMTITESNLTHNKAYNGGAIAYNGEAIIRGENITLTINNTNLTHNKATLGGAIYKQEGNLNIIQSTLIGNNADLGGTIYNEGNMTIHNTNFTNNNAIVGGAIYTNQSNSYIYNSLFKDNKAKENHTYYGLNGGAIHNTEGNLTIENSNFTNNKATLGGVIQNYQYGNLTIYNSTLNNNRAEWSGGVIQNINSNLFIKNSTLNHNNASMYGGAINCMSGNMTIIQSILNNNTAYTGGAIDDTGNTTITITNSDLSNNNAEYRGGAIYNDGAMTITLSTLNNNNAGSGGAIMNYGLYNHVNYNKTLTITLTTLNNNTAHDGGAIRNDGNLTIHNSTLNSNNVTWGGAINNNYGNITITDSTLNNNLAYGGGAINNDLGNITLIGNTINNNTGSAIRNYGSITIHNTTLNNNNASIGSGGAIANNANTTITKSTLNNNIATFGGAIFNNANMTITDSTLNNNSVGQFGGAILTGGNLNMNNSTLEDNTAGWGGAISNNANMSITDSILNNNTAGHGGAIQTGSNSNNTIKNSNITNNYVSVSKNYVVDFKDANSVIIADNTFINNTDNIRDMLFSDAKDGAEVDIHRNYYIDNFLEDSIIEQINRDIVTDNMAKSYNYDIDMDLRSIYNDTIHNGTLNVYVNGILKDSANVTYGHARIFFENSDLTKRENNITLEYITQSKHYQNITTTFKIKKEINTTLSIQAPSHMTAGDVAVINFTLKDVNNTPLSGETIHVLVDEEQVDTVITDDNGLATYNFSAFGDRIVRIEATHHTTNDSIYLSAMDVEAEIDVNKIQPEIVIKHDTLIPYVETNITIHLFDPDGKPIKNKTLTVNITEEGRPDLTGTVTTDGNGMGVFNFTPVDEGILNVNVTSHIDDIYHYASESVQISRYFITTNLVVDASTTIINKTNTIHVEVLPDDGALLSGTVELDIDGEIHTLNITNGRGTYHDYQSENAGEKLVNAKFTSNNPSYTNATTTEEFNVEKLPTHVTIEAINRTAGNVTLKVQVFPKNNTGSIVTGGNIIIESVNGENSKVIYNSTLENGELIYLTDINETGWYEFETIYHGNDYFYGEENNTGFIQVLPVDTNTVTYDKTALVGDTITLNATVTDINGNPVNDGNVTFHVDGTPVEAKLENGIATTEYTLPTTYQAGKYIIKANYQGNNKYNISSGESELKVQSPSTVTVDPVEGIALDNVTFTANVRDYHDNPVNGGYIVFKVGGKTLTYDNGTQIRTPVVNGIAQLSYQAESGWIVDSHPDLTVEATYSGTSVILSGRSDTTKVTIYKRNATVMVSAPDDYVNSTLHIDAEVKDQNGSLINDGVLVFKLNGLSLKDENNKGIIAQVVNGKVHLDVKLPFAYSAKKYNLTATYSNKIYNKATGINTTTLKAIPTYVNATVTIKDQFSKPVITGQIYNKFNNAILEGTAIINIKFDGISYAKKVKIENGTFRETLEGIPIYKPGTHKVEITAGANSHYDAVRKTITTTATPKYNVNTEFINITRNKTTTRVQAKIVDDKNKNVQKNLRITIKLNGLSFLVNKTVTNGKVDVEIDTSTLKNRNYTLELVSGANTYYNAGKATTELQKY